MKLNSAASVFTKDISTLGIGELVQISTIIAAIIVAVVLIFGVKTYLYWRKRHAQADEVGLMSADTGTSEEEIPAAKQGPPAHREAQKVLGDIRRAPAVRHFIE